MEHDQDTTTAPVELSQSWKTAPMEELSQDSHNSDSEGEEFEGSSAGPDLPVRLSQISIASDMESHDPWGQCDSLPDEDDPPNAATTLTTPGFRQRADRERTFTASAPPGMRPPTRRSEPDATEDLLLDRDLVADAELTSRRDCASEPTARPPVLRPAR